MKKVLCFGDSNTFGFIPESGKRYDKHTRWCGILAATKKFEIIEAGCNNRTAYSDNPAGFQQTGYKVLPTLLTGDLDCVILNIGINDLQKIYTTTQDDIKNGIKNLIKIVKETVPTAKILLISPAVLTQNIFNGYFATLFDETSIEKSKMLGTLYKQISSEENCAFLDLNEYTRVSALDGLHYEPEGHQKAAAAVLAKLDELL